MIKENERNIIERKYVGWKEHEFNATFTGLFLVFSGMEGLVGHL